MDSGKENMIHEKIKEGLTNFNNSEFFEAHESLEVAWKRDHTKRRLLIQGLVQFSVGCYHARKMNWVGALKVLLRARNKLIPFAGSKSFVDVALVQSEVEILIERIQRVQDLPSTQIEFLVNPKILYIEK